MRILAVLFVLLAACSSAQDVPLPSSDLGVGVSETRSEYLAFLDDSGNVALIGPDGVGGRRLTQDASSQLVYQQPTWSLQGDQLAWTALEITADGPRSEVRIAEPRTSSMGAVAIPGPPFYFSWSPDGQSLAALLSGTRSLELWAVDPAEATARVIAEGQPFYFAWSPDSQRLLSHIGDERLLLLSLEGEMEVISGASVGYQAPGWSSRGELAYVVDEDATVAGAVSVAQGTEDRQLVLTDAETRTLRVIDSFSGFVSLAFSPEGSRLAYSITPPEVRASGVASLGPLSVTNLDDTSSVEVATDPVVLYQWSPDGRQLLYVAFSGGEPGGELRWRVWNGNATTDYGPFVPTSRFVTDYLPFWDQYALSSSMWSPDGTAFAYAAQEGDRELVFVQSLDETARREVAQGSVVFWSP